MKLSDIEYFTLRLIRKYFFTTQVLVKIGKIIPYYKVNIGFSEPEKIANEYIKYSLSKNIDLNGKTILEIGTGAINSIGYEITGRYHLNKYYSFEPFIQFDYQTDKLYLSRANSKYSKPVENDHHRINSLQNIQKNSIDIIFSYSVLEHVSDLENITFDLKKCLKPSGSMIHIVDYRDHFFKYPYHFLLYSGKAWNKYLNPGDLPRWRVFDHVKAFKQEGFLVEILFSESDDDKFLKVEKKIHPEFVDYDNFALKTTNAVLFVKLDS